MSLSKDHSGVGQWHDPRRRAGFTLLEIMIVAGIISMLAAMAIQTFRQLRDASRRNAAINDLRVFAGAFEVYSLENGHWPEVRGPGEFPPEMEGLITQRAWTRRTPIGGHYTWEHDAGGITAAIRIADTGGFFASSENLRALDERLDDGNLATGRVRTATAGPGIVYILQP